MGIKNLKHKNILITAGPTWVPIDKVRVISNIATGQTGILLAKKAKQLGANVTLILGPVGNVSLNKSINLRRFIYFDELHSLIRQELNKKKYDIVIHSAAVSDYKPKKAFSDKIKSNLKNFTLDLETTVKIVDKIKKYSPRVFLTIFKLELNLPKNIMIQRARQTLKESKADLAVVNTFSENNSYRAIVINKDRIFFETGSKEKLAKKILEIISFLA